MELHEKIQELRYFFFDLDKTLWNWDDTIIGAEELIDTLREKDKQVFFHTDNTLLTREEYAKKLNSMGIPAEKEDILTSGYVAAQHLATQNITKAFAIGETGLIKELEDQDIDFSEEAEVVVAGLDRKFNYEKARKAMQILEGGGELYICGNESSFRTTSGNQPNQGMFNTGLEQLGETTLVGKPGKIFREAFQDYFDYFPDNSLMVGDRLADIKLGNQLGMTTAAVMSGEITRDHLKNAGESETPDFGISSLNRLRRRII